MKSTIFPTRTFNVCFLLLSLLCIPAVAFSAHPFTVPSKNCFLDSEQTEHATQWADSVTASLSLEEKIGQLFIYTIAPDESQANVKLLETVIKKYHIGGLLFSGGQATAQVRLTNKAQALSKIPLLITFDGEWGLSMRLKNTPKYPRNGVLGCITDSQLLYDYGREVARQCQEIGVHVNFAPVADVNINPKNPVINTRSFGELPDSVAEKVIAYSAGLESGGILSVAKHFPGHGDTQTDSHHALPVLNFSRARLDSVELLPFRRYTQANLNGIMVGHLSVPALDSSMKPASLSPSIVGQLLKKEIGFRGLVFTDALAMKGVAGSSSVCLDALLAGNDLLLVPRSLRHELPAILKAVKSGKLTEAAITERCRKVLAYKYLLGLDRGVHTPVDKLKERISTPEAKELADKLYQRATTVIEDNSGILPWKQTSEKRAALVEIGTQLKPLGDSLATAFHTVNRFPVLASAGTAFSLTLCDSLARYDQVIIAISSSQLAPYHNILKTIGNDSRLGKAVYVFFTPSKTLKSCPGLPRKSGTVILAHTTEHQMTTHLAQVLTGKETANGRLSFSIGKIYPAGAGTDLIPKAEKKNFWENFPPIDYNIFNRLKERVDSIAEYGISEGAYPGCQIAIWYQGKTLYEHCYGTLKGNGSKQVTPDCLYDLASLTKTSATLLAIMKLYDQHKIKLNDRLSAHLKWLRGTNKQYITLRDVLMHQSGLPAGLSIYGELIDKESYEGKLFSARRDRLHQIKLGTRLWGNKNFHYLPELVTTRKTAQCTLPVCDRLWVNPDFQDHIQKMIQEVPLRSRSYRYSDVGFILLRMLVEQISGMPIDQFLKEQFYAPMQLTHTGFRPLNWYERNNIVPSSRDVFLRDCELQGYVHDEWAAFQGGVSGNAGLFSNASEQAALYQMLLNNGEWKGHRYLSKETCRVFTTTTSRQSRRGLGFDRPSRNSSYNPCAPAAPVSVYGHTGFTGTCAWVDPDKEIVFVFLSNRTYPDCNNRKLMQLDIRGKLQQTLYEAGL